MTFLSTIVHGFTAIPFEKFPAWEQTDLMYGMYGIGIIIGLTLFIGTLLSIIKSKKAEIIFFGGMGISIVLLILWWILALTFDASNLAGWRNGILSILTFMFMVASLWIISIKAMNLVEKYDTVHKLKIWVLIAAWVFILIGSFILFVKLLLG